MAAIIRYIINSYTQFMEEKSDPRVAHYPFMGSPWPTIALLVFYNYFVLHLGPELMKSRRPYELKWPMILYNFVQIVMNSIFVIKSITVIWIPREYSFFCAEVDYSNNPTALLITYYAWLYFMTKLLDLLDTVFMVLRKKQNQVTFLHVYHHTGMAFAGWLGVNFVAGGHPIFFGTVNSFVHVIMYTYYLLTALFPQYKNNIWWKRHITEIQLIQFVITGLHGILALVNPNCNFPKVLIALFIPQDVFMFVMFWDFYKKAYLKKPVDKTPENPNSSNGDLTAQNKNKSD